MSVRVASDDLNPRPSKRLRHNSVDSSTSRLARDCQVAISLPPEVPSQGTPTSHLRRIPPDTLLLSLPALIIHPPTHRMHLQSISLARHALRRCLALPSLDPTSECRAWTGIAELGMMWLDAAASGFGLGEVEQALTKALTISQRHPTLRLYTPYLMILSARLAQRHQNNSKFAISTLRRLLTTLTCESKNSIPVNVLFTAHLELIHCLTHAAEEEAATLPSTSTGTSTAVGKCLVAIQEMRKVADALEPDGQPNVIVLLCTVIKLQLLVRHGVWSSVSDALVDAEKTFEAFDASLHTVQSPPNTTLGRDSVPGTLRTHLLMLGVLFHTYAGDAQAASTRLRSLHDLLDTGILEPKSITSNAPLDFLEGWNEGIIEIPFPNSNSSSNWTPPLRIRTTPPRVLNALAFLLSAVAKRDAVGRAPKKGVFARAGLELRELVGPFGGTGNGTRLARIKADLMCEVVSISTMRSDFPLSQCTLDNLTSHLLACALFDTYAARVTLLHAQLAHARGDRERARKCYRVAVFLAGQGRGGKMDEWVGCAARAGEVWVRIGEFRRLGEDEGAGCREIKEMEQLRVEGEKIAKECEGHGAALHAVGELLRACLAEEILKGKQHLHRALELATHAQDNHFRALVLALSASHYLHTARDHALTMLGTCGQLAAGLGAVPRDKGALQGIEGKGKKEKELLEGISGNLPLSMWVGKRMAELWRLEGDIEKAERQEGVNERMSKVVDVWSGR